MEKNWQIFGDFVEARRKTESGMPTTFNYLLKLNKLIKENSNVKEIL